VEQNWFAPALIGALASYVVGRIRDWQTNAQKARGLLRGMLIEIDRARECASAYVMEAERRDVWTPNYRIELDFLRSGVSTLMELSALQSLEVAAIHRLYIFASEVNRCLESLARMYEHAPPLPLSKGLEAISRRAGFGNQQPPEISHQMRTETSRTIVKCQNLLEVIPKAQLAANAALERLEWLEPQD
jgi:hypothetical protein